MAIYNVHATTAATLTIHGSRRIVSCSALNKPKSCSRIYKTISTVNHEWTLRWISPRLFHILEARVQEFLPKKTNKLSRKNGQGNIQIRETLKNSQIGSDSD